MIYPIIAGLIIGITYILGFIKCQVPYYKHFGLIPYSYESYLLKGFPSAVLFIGISIICIVISTVLISLYKLTLETVKGRLAINNKQLLIYSRVMLNLLKPIIKPLLTLSVVLLLSKWLLYAFTENVNMNILGITGVLIMTLIIISIINILPSNKLVGVFPEKTKYFLISIMLVFLLLICSIGYFIVDARHKYISHPVYTVYTTEKDGNNILSTEIINMEIILIGNEFLYGYKVDHSKQKQILIINKKTVTKIMGN